jgi:hypothetical protein
MLEFEQKISFSTMILYYFYYPKKGADHER